MKATGVVDMTECDHDYFERRAGEERSAAAGAANPAARRAHLELAARFDDMAAAANGTIVELKVLREA